jgi:hypothetical protein
MDRRIDELIRQGYSHKVAQHVDELEQAIAAAEADGARYAACDATGLINQEDMDSLVSSSVAILISNDKWMLEDLYAGVLLPGSWEFKYRIKARDALVKSLQHVFLMNYGSSMSVSDVVAVVTLNPKASTVALLSIPSSYFLKKTT